MPVVIMGKGLIIKSWDLDLTPPQEAFPMQQNQTFLALFEIFWNNTVTFVEGCSFSECDNLTHRGSALIMGMTAYALWPQGQPLERGSELGRPEHLKWSL